MPDVSAHENHHLNPDKYSSRKHSCHLASNLLKKNQHVAGCSDRVRKRSCMPSGMDTTQATRPTLVTGYHIHHLHIRSELVTLYKQQK